MLYSHPEKLLIEHLEETAKKCEFAISSSNLKYKNIRNEDFKEIAYIIGFLHDIGKSTKYFQEYLFGKSKTVNELKNHSHLSAIYAKEFLNLYFTQKDYDEILLNIFKSFAYIAIKRHHGNIINFEDELLEFYDKDLSKIKKQIESIPYSEFMDCLNPLYQKTKILLDFGIFKSKIETNTIFEDFNNFIFNFSILSNTTLKNEDRIELLYIFNIIYGSLLLSDKKDVILEKEIIRENYSDRCVYDFIIKKNFNEPKSNIDEQKNKAYNSAINNINKVFNHNQHFYSITLPTGLGKTITSFSIAQEFKKKLNLNSSRIIITIPFTSIIDQNFEVYKEIVNSDNSSIILKHHHLTEMVYKNNEDTFDYNKSEFLIETWQSEIIVTTFVQLLESFLKIEKTKLMKIPNITNSIILMDEIQTIDYKYWEVINKILKVISNIYNCYFILITATQPLIFIPEKEITEIIPDYKSYFKIFNRTKIINKSKDAITYTDFINNVEEYINNNPEKDVLIILNTKKATLKCFNELKYRINNNDEIYYLSTLKTPYERKVIINKIKNKNIKKRKIIVSTQLVEAGVDISVSTVFREIAPLDAIIQSAGRANRYSEKKEISEIFIYKIEDFFSNTMRVYGQILINKTERVINEYDEIEEVNYIKLIENYFTKIKEQSENIKSEELGFLQEWKFEEINKFSYITEEKTEQMYIILNDEAKEIWEKYVNIIESKEMDYFTKKEKFGLFKSKFYDYVINIPIPYNKKEINAENKKEYGFYLWEYYEPTKNYSYSENDEKENTGYSESEYISF